MKTKKSVGMEIPFPKDKCEDPNCPFHGSLKLRGRTFVGTVISDSMSKTVTIEFERRVYIPKYERYARKFTKIKAHNPDCIKAVKGDLVKVVETRPLSKTKNFVVVEVMRRGETIGAVIKEENIETDADVLKSAKERKEKIKQKQEEMAKESFEERDDNESGEKPEAEGDNNKETSEEEQ